MVVMGRDCGAVPDRTSERCRGQKVRTMSLGPQ